MHGAPPAAAVCSAEAGGWGRGRSRPGTPRQSRPSGCHASTANRCCPLPPLAFIIVPPAAAPAVAAVTMGRPWACRRAGRCRLSRPVRWRLWRAGSHFTGKVQPQFGAASATSAGAWHRQRRPTQAAGGLGPPPAGPSPLPRPLAPCRASAGPGRPPCGPAWPRSCAKPWLRRWWGAWGGVGDRGGAKGTADGAETPLTATSTTRWRRIPPCVAPLLLQTTSVRSQCRAWCRERQQGERGAPRRPWRRAGSPSQAPGPPAPCSRAWSGCLAGW